ncbi:MAG: o-succinylbenzoate synthase [Bacteroidia bacterium]|nr:o-succinylbenzoate synthase [Bacteroidia bacterium]
MVLKFELEKHTLIYKRPATTSRGALNDRKLWIIKVFDVLQPDIKGQGECGIIHKLSPEDTIDFDSIIEELVFKLNCGENIDPEILEQYPAFSFALESALLDLQTGGKQILFDTPFSHGLAGIKINGLVWMNDIEEMQAEAQLKLQAGFNCLKFKIGALDFELECRMIEQVRKTADSSHLQIRLDANGAFPATDALLMLKDLKRFEIHSIEQPIARNQWGEMEELCAKSPIDIALDEELIGLNIDRQAEALLKQVRPQWIVLKPSLVGGLAASDKWISIAKKYNVGWWATSALESNIGLNVIAQWVSTKETKLHQGLGTGQLYTTNFTPNTQIKLGELWRENGK